MFDHHRFGRDFSLNLQRKFLLLLCLWRGLVHKPLHVKISDLQLSSSGCRSCKSDLSNVLNSRTKICIIGRVALLVMLEANQVFLYLI